ncbi:MAG: hypothetical protein AAF570_12125 [Bacteroidota bacterium]
MKPIYLFLILLASVLTACGGGGSASGWDGTTPNTPEEKFARDLCDCMGTVMEKAGIDIAKAVELGEKLKGTKDDLGTILPESEAQEWEAKFEKVEDMSRDAECLKKLREREKEEGLKLTREFAQYSREHCMLQQVMR